MDTYNKLEYMFPNKNLSGDVKIRIFKAYAESIFLYNSQLWTLTKTMEVEIDSFAENS